MMVTTPPILLRFKSVSSPFPTAPLQLPRGGGIEDSTAGYWAIKGKANGIQTKGFKPMIY